MHKSKYRIGLRTIKTALSVMIALIITELLGSPSPVFAAIGAFVAMARTFRDSLVQAGCQFVGILIGGLIGVILVLIFDLTPVWAIGLGVLTAITFCNWVNVPIAASLAGIIVISAGIGVDGSYLFHMFYRLMDTTIGLIVGLIVNMIIKPYNNRPAIIRSFESLIETIPHYLDVYMIQNGYIDICDYDEKLRHLETELNLYDRQLYFRRKNHSLDVMFLKGMKQLALRIYQELSALSCLDALGEINESNISRLACLDLDTKAIRERKAHHEVDTVTNFHLEKLLNARKYLVDMLE